MFERSARDDLYGGTMDDDLFRREIQAAWRGEVWGEAFFLALAEHGAVSAIRDRIEMLARLEAWTRERLRPLVERLGLDSSLREDDRAGGRGRSAAWAGLDRDQIMTRLAELVVPYVVRYDRLAEAAAAGADRAILADLAEHERALAAFAREELNGNGDRSLDAVLALLG